MKTAFFVNKVSNYVPNISDYVTEIESAQTEVLRVLTDNQCTESFYEFLDKLKGENKIEGLCLGFDFMTVEEIIRERELFISTHETDVASITSNQEDVIKEDYFNPKWLPFAHDHGGNFIAIDLDPGTMGQIGQVINCGRDEVELYVLSDNFDLFLKKVILQYEKKNCRMVENRIVWKSDVHVFDDLVELVGFDRVEDDSSLAEFLLNCPKEWLSVLERNYKSPYTVEKILKNKVLYLLGTGVKDLKPLKHFKHIKKLVASGIKTDDYKPIGLLTDLTELYLGKTDFQDISDLDGLDKLKSLFISNSNVTSLIGIGKHKKLVTLSLENLEIHDLSPVIEMKKMSELHLAGIKTANIYVISSLGKIKLLDLCNIELSNLDFIQSFNKLNDLRLTSCSIEALKVISALKSLKYMTCSFEIFQASNQLSENRISYAIRGEITDHEMAVYSDYVSNS